MSRSLVFCLALCLPLCSAAEGPRDAALSQLLEQVARASSQGTPRAINADILDRGYSAEGHELINHLSVRSEHAAQMREHPQTVRAQLTQSVCANPGFRRLLARGAVLRYQFSEYPSNRPITTERFNEADCVGA